MNPLTAKLLSRCFDIHCNEFNCHQCQHKFDNTDCLGNTMDRIVNKYKKKWLTQFAQILKNENQHWISAFDGKSHLETTFEKVDELVERLIK